MIIFTLTMTLFGFVGLLIYFTRENKGHHYVLSVLAILIASAGIAAVTAHINRPSSLEGTYTIEKTSPEIDKDGVTGYTTCTVRDQDGNKHVLLAKHLKSNETIKLTYTTNFIDAWNTDQNGITWIPAK